MSDLSRRFQLMLLLAALALLATACFRDTSEAIQNQPIAREYPSPTVIQEQEPTALAPTATVEATATELEATEPAADQFALTATALIALQTQPAAGDQLAADNGSTDGGIPADQASASQLPRATIPPGQDCVHEIRAGETLFQLSLAYGVTVDAIAAASEISNPDRITVGQHITIPLCGTTGFIPPPTSIPTATPDPATIPPTAAAVELEIASADDTRNALIEQAQEALLDNALTDPSAAFSAQLAGEATPSQTYTVRQYDTLLGIAAAFGTTVEVLAALNNIEDIDSLDTGDVLQIP